MVDFSYPREVLLSLKEQVGDLYVIDHHKTAEAELAGLPFAHFDMRHSGASLAWSYFFPLKPVPKLLQYVEDSDLWQFALPKSREVRAALRSYPFDFKTWMTLNVDSLALEGTYILKHQNEMVQMMSKQAIWVRLKSVADGNIYTVPAVNATVYFSEVGEELCLQHPDAPFAAYYLDRQDKQRQWGLRSRNGFDVSNIAKAYGGGGHPAAAGFVTDRTYLGEV
jgi:oligoribonuclease NrnB/cAMP/cGMP phosphodiesterase (DHH superfamily)